MLSRGLGGCRAQFPPRFLGLRQCAAVEGFASEWPHRKLAEFCCCVETMSLSPFSRQGITTPCLSSACAASSRGRQCTGGEWDCPLGTDGLFLHHAIAVYTVHSESHARGQRGDSGASGVGPVDRSSTPWEAAGCSGRTPARPWAAVQRLHCWSSTKAWGSGWQLRPTGPQSCWQPPPFPRKVGRAAGRPA